MFLPCWNLSLKGNQIFYLFLKINLPLKKTTLFKKCLSHWVTVFKKNWSKMFKNCQNWLFLTVFDLFNRFFLNTVSHCVCIKHSESVWQFFFLKHSNSVWPTFFKHIDLFLVVNLFSAKNQKKWLPFRN